MDDKGALAAKIAKSMIFPGKSFIASTLAEAALEDILINQEGEGWRQAVGEEIKGRIESFHKEMLRVLFALLKLPWNEDMNSLQMLYIGPDPCAAAFAIADLLSVIDNISNIFTGTQFFDKVTLETVNTSSDNGFNLETGLSYLYARLKGCWDVSRLSVNDRLPQGSLDEIKLQGSWDVIIAKDIIQNFGMKEGYTLLSQLSGCLGEKGAIVLIDSARDYGGQAVNSIKYKAAAELGLGTVSPCGPGEGCTGCRLCLKDIRVKSRLLESLKREKVDSTAGADGHLNKNRPDEWMYAVLSRTTDISGRTGNECISLDEVAEGQEASFRFYIVSGHKAGSRFDICDGACGPDKYSLDLSKSPFGCISFGDLIFAEKVKITRGEKENLVSSSENSEFVNLSDFQVRERLNVAEVDEESLKFILKRFWDFDDFRKGQMDIIRKAFAGMSTLGILPTGAGKSLCFQLPALLKPGISIVVSPLKSLMKDQVDHLRDAGFEHADYIDSSMKRGERKAVLDRFRLGYIKILYVAPERLQIKSFQDELAELLKDNFINYFVIDEAHCASEWGHDFRPSYLKIIDIVERIGHPPVLAMTATASPRVLDDIVGIFRLDRDNVVLPVSFDRPEISLEVVTVEIGESKDDVLRRLLIERLPRLLDCTGPDELHAKGSGIVFTIYADPKGSSTRFFGTEYIKTMVESWGLTAERYHSRLADYVRIDIQDRYIKGDIPLLVATKGFGMGIDKPDIRYIVHMCYSNSIEAYYQEAGRAGRDQEHAHVVLVASLRHPECIRSSARDTGQPRCTDRWTCCYTGGKKCDYGMQAKFICDEYPDEPVMKRDLYRFIDMLIIKAAGKKEFDFACDESSLAESQKYLYHLQKESMVKDYKILDYLDPGARIYVLLDKGFTDISINRAVASIVARLQGFKKQKLNMLESIWNYVSNTKVCRRHFIMNYFGDSTDYTEGCGFCDIEGINAQRALGTHTGVNRERLYSSLRSAFDQNLFDYGRIHGIIEQAYREGIQEAVKIRAMRYLEDYPDNAPALYTAGIITLRRDSREAYGTDRLLACLKLLDEQQNADGILGILVEASSVVKDAVERLIENLSLPYTDSELAKKLYACLLDENIRCSLAVRYLEHQLSRISSRLEEVAL